jgi:hypothetical protein
MLANEYEPTHNEQRGPDSLLVSIQFVQLYELQFDTQFLGVPVCPGTNIGSRMGSFGSPYILM